MENSAESLFNKKTHHNSYNQKRLKLLPTKDEIKATELDLMFFDAMSIENGVRAISQFLAPVDDNRYHQKITQLPRFYAKDLPDLLEYYQLKGSAYYSVNGFSEHSTAKNKILTLKAAFLDIDFHYNQYSEDKNAVPTTKEEQIQIVTMILADAQLPHPTAIINSGNGLHLYYIFKEPKYDNSPKKVIARLLERINNYMVINFNNSIENITDVKMKADPITTNSNRLLRLPLTWNGRSQVHCLQFNQVYENMDTFVEGYLPEYDKNKVIQAEAARKASKKARKTNNDNVRMMMNLNTLNISRINDLETFSELRNHDLLGQRNEFLHIYASQYYHHANDKWEEKIYEMNDKLQSPLPTNEIDTIIKSVKRREYLYRDKKIISKLEISDDELAFMNLTKISAREQREIDRAERRQIREQRDKRITDGFKSNKSQTALAKQEGVTRKTVYNVLKRANLL